MKLNVTGNEMSAEGDAGESFIGFEADRIAQRRVYESDDSALIKEQTTT